MDRNTLSHYGWIIVMILTLSIVLIMAGPFGNYVRDGAVHVLNEFSTAGNVDIGTLGETIEDENNEPTLIAPGLYESKDDLSTPKVTWDELITQGIVSLDGTTVYVEMNEQYEPLKDELLDGYLVLPSDGSVTAIGNAVTGDGGDYIVGHVGFYYCTKLTGILIPDTVTSLSLYAFYMCDALEDITFSSGIAEMADGAIICCDRLTEIVIPEGSITIGREGIAGCRGLTTITLPSTLTEVHYEAFYGNTALTDIYYNGTKAQWDALFNENEFKSPTILTLHCNDGTTHLLAPPAC